jgi:hypothetical protein
MNNITIITSEFLELDNFRSEQYYDRLEKLGEHSDTCIVCGRRTKDTLMIHMSTSGMVAPSHLTEEELDAIGFESQGCFSIGSDCAKKLGKKYIIQI